MNPQPRNNPLTLWDDYRDGTLSEADRAAFEAHLKSHEPAAAMWKAESQWLKMLSEEDAAAADGARPSGAFVSGVLAGWKAEPSEVVARIGWRRYAGWAMGIAAMVAVFVLGAMYSKMLNPAPSGNGSAVAKVTPPKAAPPDAIGLLMNSARDGYTLAAAQPARIKQGFTSTAAMLDVSRLADLFDPGVPDPAEFVEPKRGG